MAKKIYKESILTALPATSDMKYLPGYKVKVKSGKRFKSYILDSNREWIFDQGITDDEQSKLTGLKNQEGITAQINEAVSQANGVPIPITGTVLPQGSAVPSVVTVKGMANLYGAVGGTTYTQIGGTPISVTQGKFKIGYYDRVTNLWTGSNLEYDVPAQLAVGVVKEGNTNAVQSDAVAKAIKPFTEVIDSGFVETSLDIIPTTQYVIFGNPNLKGNGQNVGVKKNFGGITIPIRPTFSASEVPTEVTLIVRKGGLWNSPIIARSKVIQNFPYDIRTDVYFALDNFVDNIDSKDIFINWNANGLIGAYGPGVANPYGKQFYTYESGGETTPFEGGSGQFGMTFHIGEIRSVINDESIDYIANRLNIESTKPSLIITKKIRLLDGLSHDMYDKNTLVPDYGDDLNNYRLLYKGDTGQKLQRGYRLQVIPASLDQSISINVMKGRTILETKIVKLLSRAANFGLGKEVDINMWADSMNTGKGHIAVPLKSFLQAKGVIPIFVGTNGGDETKTQSNSGYKWEDIYTAGRTWYDIPVSNISVSPNKDSRYSQGTSIYSVEEINISGSPGSGNISIQLVSGSSPTINGTLSKISGSGDNTIVYTGMTNKAGNPAWNPTTQKFDYSYYISNKGLIMRNNSIVTFQYGINDMFNMKSISESNDKMNIIITKVKEIINSVKAYNSTIRILIAIPTMPANQDGFGANYSLGDAEFYKTTGLVTYQKRMLQEFDTDAYEASGVYLIPVHVTVDNDNNVPNSAVYGFIVNGIVTNPPIGTKYILGGYDYILYAREVIGGNGVFYFTGDIAPPRSGQLVKDSANAGDNNIGYTHFIKTSYTPVNSSNPETVIMQNNGVHFSNAGYKDQAKIYAGAINYILL